MLPTLIFGARSIALGVCLAYRELHREYDIKGFIVSNKTGNPDMLAGLPVFDAASWLDKSVKVLIATPEDVQDGVCDFLAANGFTNYERIDSVKAAELMRKYYEAVGMFPSIHSLRENTESDVTCGKVAEGSGAIRVYSACFYRDRSLMTDAKLPSWVNKIQVGAAFSDIRVADVCDNTGENISGKNANYCELTALYWMWKNEIANATDDAYFDLYHYRRILDIDDGGVALMQANDIDVVLPYPMICEPDIREHHTRYVRESDWEAMLTAVRELYPEYMEAYERVFAGQYMYNYNVIVAKKSVMDEYCKWLFEILARTEELSVPEGADRADRYIGYLAENLLTFYFMHNKDRLRIVHTGCRMLV